MRERLCGSHDLHTRTQSMNELLGCEALVQILHYITLSCFSVYASVHNFLSVERRIASVIAFDLMNPLIANSAPKEYNRFKQNPYNPSLFLPPPTKDHGIFPIYSLTSRQQ